MTIDKNIIIIGVVVLVLLYLLVRTLVIVPQGNEYVLERLGRFLCCWSAGLHFRVPIIDRIVQKVSIKEQVLDTPPQPVITKDNVTMQIDSIVYYHVFDTKLFTYGAQNPIFALGNLSSTTLRNIVGELSLDETLTSRDTINDKLTMTLDEATDRWGIKVTRVELKNIMPPREIQAAMEKEMKAERDRRQTVLEAEGHRQAVVTRAEGDKQAMVLAAEGERDARIARAEGEARATFLAKQAEAEGLKVLKEACPNAAVLELKRYEAMVHIANGNAAKLIIPTDAVDMVKKNVMFSEVTGLGDHTDPMPAPEPEEKQDICCERFQTEAEKEALKKAEKQAQEEKED